MNNNLDERIIRYLQSWHSRNKDKKDKQGIDVCCLEWSKDWDTLHQWYLKQPHEQKELCEYCHLEGDTITHYGQHFRYGRRGINLEIDRRNAKKPYSPQNCVLACYACNNAKSDVFSYAEFKKIGKSITEVKKGTGIY